MRLRGRVPQVGPPAPGNRLVGGLQSAFVRPPPLNFGLKSLAGAICERLAIGSPSFLKRSERPTMQGR